MGFFFTKNNQIIYADTNLDLKLTYTYFKKHVYVQLPDIHSKK
jgi:hypothetical protein